MAASVFDSPLYAQLFPTGEAGRLFSDSAALRAMLLVEGALAKAQGALGVIPEISAAAIERATLEVQIDPGAIAKATGENGVSVPGLIAAFRDEMKAPEHSQYVHWGATSQDIIDTGLMLRLRQVLALAEADLIAIIKTLGLAAEEHARLPMMARTLHQHATATTWGAVLAAWGAPLIDAQAALASVRASSLWVSLSGAAGTSAALGPQAGATRAALAKGLGLIDPERSWHTDRTPLLRIVDWQGQVMAALGHIGQSLIALSASDLGEVNLGFGGGSSTMPQKQNPIGPSALVALAGQFAGARASLQHSAMHIHQRDGAAWFTEWMVIPQLCLSLASALQHTKDLAANIAPQPVQMNETLEGCLGLIHAEALSFELAKTMYRPDAQTRVKTLCAEAMAKRVPLKDLVAQQHPEVPQDLFDPAANLGDAPTHARHFAARAAALEP